MIIPVRIKARCLQRLASLVLLLTLGACHALPSPPEPTRDEAPASRPSPRGQGVLAGDVSAGPTRPAVASALLQAPDLWGRMRWGFVLPPLDNELAESHARRFARDVFLVRRAEQIRLYLPMIVGELEARRMPLELAMLPLVESALNPHAQSLVGATGPWQFMAPTAKRFARRTSRLVDDRKNVQRATGAALDYLQKLHGQFGDWHLAMAAYNWGEGRVQTAADRFRRQGIAPDFNAMSAAMPAETRHYVPQIAALARLVANPALYGGRLPEVPDGSGLVSIPLARDMDLALAMQFSGLSQTRFLALNPAARPPLLLAAATPRLWMPPEAAERFDLALAAHPGRLASWSILRLSATEPLEHIAQRHGLAEDVLRRANNIPRGMKPLAGSVLLLPIAPRDGTSADHVTVAGAGLALAPDTLRVDIPARKGETLARIAQRCGVSAVDLGRWNNMAFGSRLRKGQVLIIWVARDKAGPLLAAARSVAGANALVSSIANAGEPARPSSSARLTTMTRVPVSTSTQMQQNRASLTRKT